MRRAILSIFGGVLMLGSAALGQQSTPPVPAQSGQQNSEAGPVVTIAAKPISPAALSGTWDYNDALSVDAATGRPEHAPRSATQRAAPASGTAGSRGGGSGSGGSDRPAGGGTTATGGGPSGGSSPTREGGGRDSFDEARRAMAAVIAAERRTYVRDLLEVPELLTIRATPEEVTMVDDLARTRTYSTNGRMQKYQLSAARYEARGTWSDNYYRKEIEGANNFRMSETYFISEDGNRLFVIIRIGDPKRPASLAGVNRVYDRVVSGSR